jgi:three-Cys-motif partner protein
MGGRIRMTKADQEHFEDYREQTRIKHEILRKYLAPYYRIRGRGDFHKNLVYIDAFAGAGEYQSDDGPQPGSPLRALDVFA